MGGRRIPDKEIICILDCDQIVHPDFFQRTVHLMDGGDDVGLVSCLQAQYMDVALSYFWSHNQRLLGSWAAHNISALEQGMQVLNDRTWRLAHISIYEDAVESSGC